MREALAAAIADLPWCNTYHAYEDTSFGLKTKRLHGVLQYGQEIERCLMHPLAPAKHSSDCIAMRIPGAAPA